MQNINQCPTIFCNCQSIPIPFNTNSIYQPTTIQSPDIEISYRLYMYIIFIVLFIMFSIQLSMRWFIYKDYYPLKQKSPLLTIIMVFSICIQIILYPLIYSINYFTYSFTDPKIRGLFRAIQVGMECSIYSIYLLRCLRIAYAHEVDKSRRKTLSFKIFQRQWVLATAVMLAGVLRLAAAIADLNSNQASINNFAFGFQIAVFGNDEGYVDAQSTFIIHNLVAGFIWQLILIYCMLLHKNVNYRYSMNRQISLILAATQVTNLLHIGILARTLTQNSTMHYLCSITTIYPMTQFLRLVNLLIAFVISVIIPLTQKKVYHVLLPTGPHYGFIKTMRNFLMQKQFLRVFSKFLAHLNQQQNTDYYTKLLKFWQQTLLLRFQSKLKPQLQKLASIITLVQSIQNQNMFQEHSQLINNLKGTINGLHDSILEPGSIGEQGDINIQNETSNRVQNSSNKIFKTSYGSNHSNKQFHQQIQNMQQRKKQLQQQLLQKRKQKYRQSINDKIDELQQIALQKLNKIYIQKYYITQSYLYLKQIMNQYKKVNLNLIMLNMALIVDDQNQFN